MEPPSSKLCKTSPTANQTTQKDDTFQNTLNHTKNNINIVGHKRKFKFQIANVSIEYN